VVIGGVVNALKEINTKKGDRMAFVTLEDLSGVVEVIIFPELYKNSILLLKGEEPVFIKGRMDAGEENIKVIANEVLPFDKAVGKLTTSIHLRVNSSGLSLQDLVAIREIFQDCPGDCPAYLHLILEKSEAVIVLGDEWKVSSSDQLAHRLRDLLGYDAVSFQT
jgi:DNA polymerase-3 subunit alpha